MKLYSYHDRKAESWTPPMTLVNDDIARRRARMDLGSMPKEVQEDIDLVRIGHFDPDTGTLEVDENYLIIAVQYPQKKED